MEIDYTMENNKVEPVVSERYGHSCYELKISGSDAFIIMSEKSDGRWVWYAPTFTDAYPGSIHAWLFERILQNGMAIAGIDVGESYGNKNGRAIFSRFYSYLIEKYPLRSRAVLLAQSRGGLMLYNWAIENPCFVDRIAGIYTVCDIRSYPGIDIAAMAYKVTVQEMEKKLEQNNPIDRLGSLISNKIRICHLHGDSDKTVPIEQNSGKLVSKYKELGGDGRLITIRGAGHEEINEFFKCKELLHFIIE